MSRHWSSNLPRPESHRMRLPFLKEHTVGGHQYPKQGQTTMAYPGFKPIFKYRYIKSLFQLVINKISFY